MCGQTDNIYIIYTHIVQLQPVRREIHYYFIDNAIYTGGLSVCSWLVTLHRIVWAYSTLINSSLYKVSLKCDNFMWLVWVISCKQFLKQQTHLNRYHAKRICNNCCRVWYDNGRVLMIQATYSFYKKMFCVKWPVFSDSVSKPAYISSHMVFT